MSRVRTYLDDARPSSVVEPDGGHVFLPRFGQALEPRSLTFKAIACLKQSDLGKSGACHLLRHTCATLMLEGGADPCDGTAFLVCYANGFVAGFQYRGDAHRFKAALGRRLGKFGLSRF